jgi:RNA polymerase sigma factor (sigma-70 family)
MIVSLTNLPDPTGCGEPDMADENETDPESVVIRSALELLKENERAVVEAIYFEGLTQDEYATRLGISQPAVSKLLARSLKKLKILISE